MTPSATIMTTTLRLNTTFIMSHRNWLAWHPSSVDDRRDEYIHCSIYSQLIFFLHASVIPSSQKLPVTVAVNKLTGRKVQYYPLEQRKGRISPSQRSANNNPKPG